MTYTPDFIDSIDAIEAIGTIDFLDVLEILCTDLCDLCVDPPRADTVIGPYKPKAPLNLLTDL